MISTLAIKQQQLKRGYFQTGTGDTVMLIMGSCRVAPLVWYFEKWNEHNGNPYTICSIDAFSWNWDLQENRVDYEAELLKQEANYELLEMLARTKIFVHEWYANAGMFNCNKEAPKNIYQFNLKPEIDICVPSWNDHFVLFADILAFNPDMRKKAMQDFNVNNKLSYQTELELFKLSQDALDKFYEVCRKSHIPKMEHYFSNNFMEFRMWHTYNHISKHFSIWIFVEILKQMGHEVSVELYDEISAVDMFDNSQTPLTDYDLKWRNYKWNEPVVELRSKL